MNCRTALALLYVSAAIASTSAQAGGTGCDKGYRDATPAERTTMTAVLQTVKASLPPAPPGWTILGDDAISVPKSRCGDADPKPWSYGFTRYYQHVDDQDTRDAAMAAAADTMKADLAKKQPKLDALTAQMDALGKQLGAAAQAGDTAKMETLSRQIDAVGNEYTRLIESGDAQAQLDVAAKVASRDLEMRITVDVNPTAAPRGADAATFAVPPRANSAWRWSASRGDVQEDNVVVLLGPWRPGTDNVSTPAYAPAASTPDAHALAVHVTADAGRVAATTNAIDFAALAALLK